ncbi:MAG TPA: DNA-processing protein DprA [Spirochaetota bacterium]|nr:DNA-processing protein DprA [Spirochaetota bacterium]
MNDEKIYDIAFSFDESITPIEKKFLIEKYGSSKEVLKLSKGLLKNILGRKWTGNRYNPENFIEQSKKMADFMDKASIKTVRFNEDDYPDLLKEIPDLPFLLYYRGNIQYDYNRSIAIVGTRQPNFEGVERVNHFTETLINNGFTIVSGLALGIDAESHKKTLQNKGKTIAVLGCGIDRIYPVENREIGRAILEHDGALISEYPPGVEPKKWYFPKRNRIIVGLSKSVLIVQSPERSGSLISAFLSADYNRNLYVCSANPNCSTDEGNRILIRTGASEVHTPDDILTDMMAG